MEGRIKISILNSEDEEDSEATKEFAQLLEGQKLLIEVDPELSSKLGEGMTRHFSFPVDEIVVSTIGSGIISKYEDGIEHETPGHRIVLFSSGRK